MEEEYSVPKIREISSEYVSNKKVVSLGCWRAVGPNDC